MSQAITQLHERPSRDALKPLKECQNLNEVFKTNDFFDRIKKSVPKHVTPDRMLRTFMAATGKSPDLMKCNMRSVIGAMLTLSQLGLEPNTPLGQAYLIPFNGRERNPATGKWDLEVTNLNLILGYQGLLDLSYRAPKFKGVQAQVVYKADSFSFEYGTDAHVRHKPSGRYAEDEDPIWAYAHAQLEGGQMFEVLPWSDVVRIRNRSQGFQAALAAKERSEEKGRRPPKTWTEAPWVRHPIAMGRKTAFRSLSKWLPRSAELAAAVALDERQDEELVDFGPVVDGADFTEGELPGVDVDRAATPDAAFGQRTQTVESSENQTTTVGGNVATVKQLDPDHPALQGETLYQAKGRAVREQSVERGTTPPSTPREERLVQERQQIQATIEVDGLSFFVLDENGEYLSNEPTTDPVEFADTVLGMWKQSANREALIENNRDGLEEAAAASEAAKLIVDQIMPTGPERFQVVTVPEGRGGWNAYADAIAKALDPEDGMDVTPDRLEEWCNEQGPSILRAPLKIRTQVARIIAEYAAGLKVDIPPVIVQAMRNGSRQVTEQKPSEQAATGEKAQQQTQETSSDPVTQTQQSEENKPDQMAHDLAESIRKATSKVEGFEQDIKAAAEHGKLLDFMANKAVHSLVSRMQDVKKEPDFRPLYNRLLDACRSQPAFFEAHADLRISYPELVEDVNDRHIAKEAGC